MKSLKQFVLEGATTKVPAEEMFDILLENFNSGGNIQLVMEYFLQKCFDDAPNKDFHTAIGDAIYNIYDENLK